MANDTSPAVFSLQLRPLTEDARFRDTVETWIKIYVALEDISSHPVLTGPQDVEVQSVMLIFFLVL